MTSDAVKHSPFWKLNSASFAQLILDKNLKKIQSFGRTLTSKVIWKSSKLIRRQNLIRHLRLHRNWQDIFSSSSSAHISKNQQNPKFFKDPRDFVTIHLCQQPMTTHRQYEHLSSWNEACPYQYNKIITYYGTSVSIYVHTLIKHNCDKSLHSGDDSASRVSRCQLTWKQQPTFITCMVHTTLRLLYMDSMLTRSASNSLASAK